MGPLISVITINYNESDHLLRTIESMLSQTFSNVEYIIVDGGSTDDSVIVIKEHEDKISTWVSEPDGGIYSAMNKGIALAKGTYVYMLNSGVTFYDNEVLSKVARHLSLSSEDIVFGNVEEESTEGKRIVYSPNDLPFSYFVGGYRSVHHQAQFVRRDFHDKVGGYDESVKITADYNFLVCALHKHSCSYKLLDVVVACCDRFGLSCDLESLETILKEKKLFFDQEFSSFVLEYENFFSDIKTLKRAVSHERAKRTFSRMVRLVKRLPILGDLVKNIDLSDPSIEDYKAKFKQFSKPKGRK
jgi:glycosyltransferase involved in cell wall biosynthesis